MIKTQHEPKQNATTYKVGRFVIQYCGILHRRSSSETSSVHVSEGKRSTSSSEDPVLQKAISLASTQSNCSTPSSSNSQTPVRYVSLSGLMAKSSSLNPMRPNNNNNNNQTSTSLTTAELSHYSQYSDYNRSKSVCLFENKSSSPHPVYNPEFFRQQHVESVPEENEPPQIVNSLNYPQQQYQQQSQQQQQVFQADELVIQQPSFDNNINNSNNSSVSEPPLLPQPAANDKQPLLIHPIVFEEIPAVISPDNQYLHNQQNQPKSFDPSTFFTEPDMVIDNHNNNNNIDSPQHSKSMVEPELLFNIDEIQQQNIIQPIQPIQPPIPLPISSYINEQTYAPPTPPPTEQIPSPQEEQYQQQYQHQQQQQNHLIPTPPPPADLIEEQLLLVQQQQQQQEQQEQQQIINSNNSRNISSITNPRIEILQRSSSNHSTDSVESPFVSSVKELGTPCSSPIWDDLPKESQVDLLCQLIQTVNTDGQIYDLMFTETNQDWKKRTRHSLLNELEQLKNKNKSLQDQYNQLKNLQNKNVSI